MNMTGFQYNFVYKSRHKGMLLVGLDLAPTLLFVIPVFPEERFYLLCFQTSYLLL